MSRKAILMLAVLTACCLWSFGQEVKIQAETPFAYAYFEGSGPYQQIGAKIGELMQEVGKQGIESAGAPFSLYLNSPQDVKSPAELKWLVGLPVGSQARVAVPLKKGEFNFTQTAHYLYKGPYEAVAPAYAKIMGFIAANGYRPAGPIMEQYWNDPMTVTPDQLLTEIIVPVTKK